MRLLGCIARDRTSRGRAGTTCDRTGHRQVDPILLIVLCTLRGNGLLQRGADTCRVGGAANAPVGRNELVQGGTMACSD